MGGGKLKYSYFYVTPFIVQKHKIILKHTDAFFTNRFECFCKSNSFQILYSCAPLN